MVVAPMCSTIKFAVTADKSGMRRLDGTQKTGSREMVASRASPEKSGVEPPQSKAPTARNIVALGNAQGNETENISRAEGPTHDAFVFRDGTGFQPLDFLLHHHSYGVAIGYDGLGLWPNGKYVRLDSPAYQLPVFDVSVCGGVKAKPTTCF
jgi:hypothetical protein